jgi:Bacterial Ig-like domain (group 3)
MSTGSCTRHRAARRRAVRLLLLAATLLAALPAAAHAEFSSSKVAYIYDKALFPCTTQCGMNAEGIHQTGFEPRASIFTNAVGGEFPGSGNEGHYTPSGGSEVALKNVTLEELDAKPHLLEEEGFDTAILYQTCKIAEHAAALGGINAFLESAHKVMVFDADGCSAGTSLGEANWSGFLFPFATNNPGPRGASGPYTVVEPSTLTAGLSTGEQEGDAVGDANIFTSSSVHWFQAIAATNVESVNGTVMAYSRTASGGLALYEGEDFWFTFVPTAHLKQVFDNMLNQHWNPDKLPGTRFVCTSCATSVTTKLSSALVPDSAAVTDSATVAAAAGAPTPTGSVTFTVYSDPNCQLPVAGHAQTVALTAGSAATSPIALPAGTYYLQAQYAGDTGHVGSISLCTSEVLRVLGEPKPTHPIVVRVANGEIEGEWEIIEEGELEFEGEVLEEAELFGPNGERAQFPALGGLGSEGFAVAAKHKKCKKGFVRKGKRCVSKKPVKYGKTHLAITKPGRYKLRIKPSKAVLRALKKGRTLRVRTTLTFTPHGTTTHLVQTSKVKVHLKKKHHHK